MQSLKRLCLALCLAMTVATVTAASAAEGLVSSMRMVSAVTEMNGYAIRPAFDLAGNIIQGDEAPTQAFEIVRPGNGPVTLGRLYTSCSCIQLEATQKHFADGERAVLTLRNVKPTPHDGQVYQIYVQTTSPTRVTLRYNVFVQSDRWVKSHQLSAQAPAAAADIATVNAEMTEVQSQ